MKKTIIYVVSVTLFLASCKEKKAVVTAENSDVIPVKTMPLQYGQTAGNIEASGHFTTDNTAYLSFKTDGIINKILIKEGEKVTKGQLLATLDLTEINSKVNQYKLGLEKAKRDYERASNLYKDSVATLEQLQNAKTACDVATQQLTAAEYNLAHSRIIATENGFVLKKLAAEGQLVTAGTPVFLNNATTRGNWILKAGLSDQQWAEININDKATIYTDTRPNAPLEGKIVRKSEGVDATSGMLSADIQIADGNNASLVEGMYGKATIAMTPTKDSTMNGYMIPYDAILDGDGRTGYVFVTNDNATAHKVKITIDRLLKNNVLVTEGLQGVQSVIVTGGAYLTENSKIKIIQ